MSKRPVLRYIGKGTHLHGVPARDLYREELKYYDIPALLLSGLYVEVKEPPKKADKVEEVE